MTRRFNLDGAFRVISDKARLNDAAVVGPVVWHPYLDEHGIKDGEPDDRIWSVIVSASHDTPGGPEFHCDHLVLGLAAAEGNPAWEAAFDSVITVRRFSEITYAEAQEAREQVAGMPRTRFAEVYTFDTELAGA